MAVLDWLQQLLGGGQQADPGRAVDRPYDFDQAYQPPPRPPSPTVAEAYDTAMGLTGIPDMQQAYQAYQRGEYLPALGQGAAGLANAASIAVPALRGAGPVARTVGPLLGDEIGAVGDLRGIRAFHGSPHSFDRFDLSKIGSGEGAQAYGHGLYFAENPGTAEFYRDTVGTRAGPTFNWTNDRVLSENDAAKWLQNNFNMPTGFAAKRLLNDVAAGRGWDELRQGSPKHWGPAVDWLEANKVTANPINQGHMYEVDINAKPEDFLNWDKPLPEQPQAAIDIAKDKWWGDPSPKLTGEDIYRSLAFKNPADTARTLKDAGIPGVRYLDQGSRNLGDPVAIQKQIDLANRFVNDKDLLPSDRAGWARQLAEWQEDLAKASQPQSSNYAIWTPEIVTIMRRYGLLPPLAAGGLLAAQPGEAAQP